MVTDSYLKMTCHVWKLCTEMESAQNHVKCPSSFSTAYPDATFKVITPQNVDEILQ